MSETTDWYNLPDMEVYPMNQDHKDLKNRAPEYVSVTNTPRSTNDARHSPNWSTDRQGDHYSAAGDTWKDLYQITKQTRLETDSDARKDLPIYSGVMRYFPDALAEVARLSKIGNDKHNPGEPLHWARSKSTDELDCLCRHLAECGTIDTDGLYHDVKVAWRALSNLQKLMERVKGLPISPGSKA
jgi:hypothetical protein